MATTINATVTIQTVCEYNLDWFGNLSQMLVETRDRPTFPQGEQVENFRFVDRVKIEYELEGKPVVVDLNHDNFFEYDPADYLDQVYGITERYFLPGARRFTHEEWSAALKAKEFSEEEVFADFSAAYYGHEHKGDLIRGCRGNWYQPWDDGDVLLEEVPAPAG